MSGDLVSVDRLLSVVRTLEEQLRMERFRFLLPSKSAVGFELIPNEGRVLAGTFASKGWLCLGKEAEGAQIHNSVG